MQREGFVLDFCPTFRILSFCYVGQKTSVTVHKTTHWVVLFTAFEPLSLRRLEKERTTRLGGSSFWRRERDSNPRVLAHKLISRNRGSVTISPSASLIFEKSADFSAFLPPICQIFRKSDRKVIENEVLSALK